MKANGRRNISYRGNTYITEKETCQMIGISRMALRRNPVLISALGFVNLNGHPYYRYDKVNDVCERLSDYTLRQHMAIKPVNTQDRISKGETVIYGLICYPKKRRIK